MTFFDRDGKSISAQDFINYYQECYYLQGPESKQFIKDVSVNSRIAESRIENILDTGIQDKDDVNFLLAWKIGGIDHAKSEDEKSIQYIASWKGTAVTVKNGAFQFSCARDPFCKFCEGIVKIAHDYQGPYDDNTKKSILSDILREARDAKVTGFGPVYFLTLLYFVSKGCSPIFDRCAYKAVKAVCCEKKPTEIWYENPSGKSKDSILKVVNDYKWYLERVFGTSVIKRTVDRALWVYGHNSVWIK